MLFREGISKKTARPERHASCHRPSDRLVPRSRGCTLSRHMNSSGHGSHQQMPSSASSVAGAFVRPGGTEAVGATPRGDQGGATDANVSDVYVWRLCATLDHRVFRTTVRRHRSGTMSCGDIHQKRVAHTRRGVAPSNTKRIVVCYAHATVSSHVPFLRICCRVRPPLSRARRTESACA
jgi:hypothetical protein